MLRNFTSFLFVVLLVMISGCVPYYKLSKQEFPQGVDLDTHQNIYKNFVKSQSVFRQFTTLAHFDAMLLSDQTRMAYVDIYCSKRGKCKDAQEAMLKRQLEENRHWISFYILADIRDAFNGAMNDKSPVWTPYLKVDDIKLEPVSIKEVELEPEYVNLFGGKVNSFNTAYLVSFSALDQSGKFYTDQCKGLSLVFSSIDKSCSLEWNFEQLKNNGQQINKKGKKINKTIPKEIDFYWGV